MHLTKMLGKGSYKRLASETFACGGKIQPNFLGNNQFSIQMVGDNYQTFKTKVCSENRSVTSIHADVQSLAADCTVVLQ